MNSEGGQSIVDLHKGFLLRKSGLIGEGRSCPKKILSNFFGAITRTSSGKINIITQ